ncbi:peptide deformylase [Sneathiella limimaris]|uniref:peptide deformylase n=1 Tax=Sneathiella limimaris TaxID=1964213 RepID=UPI00146E3D46|nr:peptide deformylase [Sneathiella limimaris]
MTTRKLSLVVAPDPIFRQKAKPVAEVTDETRDYVRQMFDILETEKGIGIGANMVGLTEQIIVIHMKDGGPGDYLAMINPQILQSSEETQEFEEASLSYPGISASITRPAQIEVQYLDQQGEERTLKADGFLSTVIQHEMDYLQGRTYLDHLSRLKRNTLLRKYQKLRQGR